MPSNEDPEFWEKTNGNVTLRMSTTMESKGSYPFGIHPERVIRFLQRDAASNGALSREVGLMRDLSDEEVRARFDKMLADDDKPETDGQDD